MEELNKEAARKQFEYWTDRLDLKHSFSFDEVWETLLKKRQSNKENFRNGVVAFEEHIKKLPGCLGENPFPLEHSFADGLYIRQLTVPPKTLTVTKIHKQEHAFFLMKGTISILTEEGVKKFTAPYQGITKIGTKRIIWHHDEVIFTTVHATKETDIEKIEAEVTTNDFNEIENDQRLLDFIDVVAKEE